MDSCQVSSRDSRKRHAAETHLPQEPVKRTQTKRAAPRNSASAHSLLICRPPTSGQAVRRPCGRADNSPAKPPRAPPPLQERRRRRTMRPADSRIAATDSTPIATPVTGSHRSRTLSAEGRSAALVRPFASWLLPAPTTTSTTEPQVSFPTVIRHPAVRSTEGPAPSSSCHLRELSPWPDQRRPPVTCAPSPESHTTGAHSKECCANHLPNTGSRRSSQVTPSPPETA